MRFAYRGVRDMGAPGVSMAPCRHAVPSVRMCREQEEDSIWPRHAGPLLSKLLRKAERMRAAVAAEAEGDGGGGQEMPAGRPSSTVQGTNTWSRLTGPLLAPTEGVLRIRRKARPSELAAIEAWSCMVRPPRMPCCCCCCASASTLGCTSTAGT